MASAFPHPFLSTHISTPPGSLTLQAIEYWVWENDSRRNFPGRQLWVTTNSVTFLNN
jgi:hypothetical protein